MDEMIRNHRFELQKIEYICAANFSDFVLLTLQGLERFGERVRIKRPNINNNYEK